MTTEENFQKARETVISELQRQNFEILADSLFLDSKDILAGRSNDKIIVRVIFSVYPEKSASPSNEEISEFKSIATKSNRRPRIALVHIEKTGIIKKPFWYDL